MNISKFESLPTELCLSIFNYLSSFDLFNAFFHINNKRFEQIIDCQSFIFNTKLISYFKMNQILNTSNYFLLVRTIILDNSDSCQAFYKYWRENSSILITSKLERLIVKKMEYYLYGFVEFPFQSLSFGNSLKCLHVIFRYTCSDSSYMLFINNLIKAQISFHTMIFEMEKDSYYTEYNLSSLTELKNLHWTNTVQLSLIVQFPFEIIFILQKSAIPFLEYLYITIEQEQSNTKPYLNELSPRFEFCENHIRQMTDASRLQTLILRHLSLDKVTILIRSLNMPLLKKLILVEIFDETLIHYEELRQIVNNKYLPFLKEFYFLIYFPGDLYEEFQKVIIDKLDMIWPFNNLAYHVEDQLLPFYNVYKKTKKTILFYTFPLDILLKYTRTIHNHSFVQYSKQINRHCIRWMCNQIDNLTQLTNTFNKLATGYVDTLVLQFYEMKRFLQNNEFISLWSPMRFPWLRSVIFDFEYKVIKQLDRAYIIDQILRVSPRLLKVTVEWEDLCLCSYSNRNVKHLNLFVNKRCKDPNVYININYLFQLLPNICCLEIGGIDLLFNENLVKFIVKIVDTIIKLVQLVLNKNGLIPIDPEIPISMKQAIFNTGNKRLFNSNICQITFPQRNKLRIWLS